RRRFFLSIALPQDNFECTRPPRTGTCVNRLAVHVAWTDAADVVASHSAPKRLTDLIGNSIRVTGTIRQRQVCEASPLQPVIGAGITNIAKLRRRVERFIQIEEQTEDRHLLYVGQKMLMPGIGVPVVEFASIGKRSCVVVIIQSRKAVLF